MKSLSVFYGIFLLFFFFDVKSQEIQQSENKDSILTTTYRIYIDSNIFCDVVYYYYDSSEYKVYFLSKKDTLSTEIWFFSFKETFSENREADLIYSSYVGMYKKIPDKFIDFNILEYPIKDFYTLEIEEKEIEFLIKGIKSKVNKSLPKKRKIWKI